jgi:asparagine synthase (glutamine-hydrolysing)
VKTFAGGYDDQPRASELSWAARAAQRLGTQHRALHVSAREAARALPDVAWDLDEPVADPAALPLWFLARYAREEVTVILSGEGGDEAFAGYAQYQHMLRMERLRAGGRVVTRLAELAARVAPTARLRRAAALAALPLEERYRGVSRAFDRAGLAALLGGGAEAAERAVRAALAPRWRASAHMTPLARMLYLDLTVWLPDDLLAKADKVTMSAGLELRVPLLDHRLVERAFALPDRYKVAGGEGKRLLRRAARGRVPRPILERPKMGFATPAAAWLRGPLAELTRSVLTDGASLAAERAARTQVEHLIAEHARGADRTAELWTLLDLELWRARLAQLAPLSDERAAARLEPAAGDAP